jgi:hypothetical protein
MERISTAEELRRLNDGECPTPSKPPSQANANANANIQKRHMSRNQEIWNAITMIVTPGFALYFLLSGSWVLESDKLQAQEALLVDKSSSHPESFMNMFPFEHQEKCISSNMFPYLHALPPLATICVVLGYLLHSPCSIYYHLMCAFKLKTAPERINHWSRRLDQAMIHGMAVFINYGISGSLSYCLATLVFSFDSAFRLFKPGFRPKSNQVRMLISLITTALPVIMNGSHEEFLQLLIIYAISSWIFLAYPFGGYSHGIFHLAMALSNPLQLSLSTRLLGSQDAIDLAAKCAVLAEVSGL